MISVVSKHLSLFYTRWPLDDSEYLGALHYIEQLRYRGEQFVRLCSENLKAPESFSPGIDVIGDELDHLYSSMIIWFELESFAKGAKSFLDHLWRVVGRHHPELRDHPDVKNQQYILKAFNKLRACDGPFTSSDAFYLIEQMLEEWGRYWSGFRNFSEYADPLGGMLSAAVGSIETRFDNGVRTQDILLPDQFPKYNENKQDFSFSYDSRVMASESIGRVIDSIDRCFPGVVIEIHNKSIQPTGGAGG